MKQILLVFLGGGIGSVFRYLLGKGINHYFSLIFPLGTFIANILGCLLIGVVFGLVSKSKVNAEWVLLLTTGFCGGFTTFSSFAYENKVLLEEGNYLYFFAYVAGSILVGFAAVFLGTGITRYLLP